MRVRPTDDTQSRLEGRGQEDRSAHRYLPGWKVLAVFRAKGRGRSRKEGAVGRMGTLLGPS